MIEIFFINLQNFKWLIARLVFVTTLRSIISNRYRHGLPPLPRA